VIDTIEGATYERRERCGCPLCGRIHPARVIAVQFGMLASVAECAGCRIAYQTPRPAPEASLAYMEMRWRSPDAYVADDESQRARARMQLQRIAPLVGPRPRLLDFGAGVGTFVRAARDEGWGAIGVERSAAAIERARTRNAVDLVSDLSHVAGRFDAITLLDVVEHLRDPQGTVEALRTYLRDGGWMIFETGNWESWRRLAAGDAWGLYLFDHQYYFSPASLESLVGRAGLVDFQLLADPAHETGAPDTADERNAHGTALGRWPDHASIDIMLAAARNA
jgi:SAM-dependent methyltransferase